MSITITTVERIGSVAADPAAVAGSGFLYTKLIAGEIQLFYRSDLGTVDQLTPSAGTPSPWQRIGTTVDLTVGTDLFVQPTTDAQTALGQQTKRWASANVSGAFNGWGTTVEAAPRAKLDGSTATGTITLGDGTGVNDVSIFKAPGGQVIRVIANEIQRLESTLVLSTFRVAPGGGDDLFVSAAPAVATAAATAFTGGSAHLSAGDSANNGAAGAIGADVDISAGSAASGAGAFVGGNVNIGVGDGAAGGAPGEVVMTNVATSAGPNVVPGTDNTGNLGKQTARWLSANVSGAFNGWGTTVEAAPRAKLDGSTTSGTLTLGDGTGVNDVTMTRIATRTLRVVANGIQRLESTFVLETFRVAAGGGDDLFVKGADAVATVAATAFTGGVVSISAGDAASNGAAGAAGADLDLASGSAASGAGAFDGGNVNVGVGGGAGGGVSGQVRMQDTSGNGPDVIPVTDNTGKLGTTTNRWAEVNAVTVTSGDVVFTDPGCPICNRPFAEGEDLVLRVIKTTLDEHGPRTRTVPAHHGCR